MLRYPDLQVDVTAEINRYKVGIRPLIIRDIIAKSKGIIIYFSSRKPWTYEKLTYLKFSNSTK